MTDDTMLRCSGILGQLETRYADMYTPEPKGGGGDKGYCFINPPRNFSWTVTKTGEKERQKPSEQTQLNEVVSSLGVSDEEERREDEEDQSDDEEHEEHEEHEEEEEEEEMEDDQTTKFARPELSDIHLALRQAQQDMSTAAENSGSQSQNGYILTLRQLLHEEWWKGPSRKSNVGESSPLVVSAS